MSDFALAPDDFDLGQLPAEFYADPYPTYARLRAETPVLACADSSYFLTRYEDLNTVYRDARLFSSDKRIQFGPVFGEDSPLYEHHTTSLVFNDPPLHTRVRKAIGNAAYLSLSCGPCGQMIEPLGEVSKDEVYDSFLRQLRGASQSAIDLICIETMTDLTEATLAVRAANGHGAPPGARILVLSNQPADFAPSSLNSSARIAILYRTCSVAAVGITFPLSPLSVLPHKTANRIPSGNAAALCIAIPDNSVSETTCKGANGIESINIRID